MVAKGLREEVGGKSDERALTTSARLLYPSRMESRVIINTNIGRWLIFVIDAWIRTNISGSSKPSYSSP
jgi:hypothetical protein